MASCVICIFWVITICVLAFLTREISVTGDIFKACGSRREDHVLVPLQPDCRHRILEEFQRFQRPERSGPIQAPCYFQWFDRGSACNALKPFKRLVFAGDSLTRGVHDSLLMILRGDLAYGGLSSHLHPQQADACRCEAAHHRECKYSTAGWKGIDHRNGSAVWHSVHKECGIDVELFTCIKTMLALARFKPS